MMLCKIAELITKVPERGGLAPLFQEYICSDVEAADIIIDEGKYDFTKYDNTLSDELIIYLESGRQFFVELLHHEGFYLHASAVELNGRAYLFSAPCGTGKSTHTRLWRETFGENVHIFNDDKPPLRKLDDVWYAYGTPWCGKDHININMKVPVSGICFLKQAQENRIRRLTAREAVTRIINQTIHRYKNLDRLDLMLSHVDSLVRSIPVFELENRPEPAAAMLSFETMRKAAEELGL